MGSTNLIEEEESNKKKSIEKMIDIDGNIYQTIDIGGKTWTVDNLKTTKYNDGTEIPLVTVHLEWESIIKHGYCWYNNDEKNQNKYGALYNWYAIDSKQLAPKGWHVPSKEEWEEFESYLHNYNNDKTRINRKILAKIKAISKNAITNNSPGFVEVLGGYRHIDGLFFYIDYGGGWWSSTGHGLSGAWYRYTGYGRSGVSRNDNNKTLGFSVRCIKDY